MLIENKIQIEAIKTREYMVAEKDGVVMVSDGKIIVYIKAKDFLLDVEKQKKLPLKGIECYYPQTLLGNKRKAKLSNRILLTGIRKLRGIIDLQNDKYIWFDNAYVKMFSDCEVWIVGEGDFPCALFTRYGEAVGLVFPVRVAEEWI